MSLKSKKMLSLLGVTIGSLMPMVASHAAATVTPSNSQYAAPATTMADQPAADAEVTDASSKVTTDAKAKPSENKAGFKDQPKAPEFTWNGSYIGIFGGGAWGNSNLNTNAGNVTPVTYFISSENINSISQHGSGTVNPSTGLVGIQAGNNTQVGKFVYGAVIDYGSLSMSGSKSANNVTYPTVDAQYKLKTYMSTSWLASLRARLGYVPSQSWPLMYVTAGVGITNIHVYNSFMDNGGSHGVGGATNSKVKPGWVVGAGVEMPLRVNWTVDAEYQHVHFGSNTANGFVICGAGCLGKSPYSTSANLNANMVRIGLNYKFS